MNKLILWLVLYLNIASAMAGTGSGQVVNIWITDDSFAVLFQLDGELKGSPRCNETGHFALNLRKPGGVAAYMALLEARREKYFVQAEGLNTCGNHWKSEDLLDLQIK